MKDAPSFDIKQFYHLLDGVVDEYGVYLFRGFSSSRLFSLHGSSDGRANIRTLTVP